MVFHDPGQSEDCLSLNIWTPATAQPDAKIPVMVWIYGGGFTAGASSEARQNGEFLAQRNVIVVTLNYRLGILGFFAHPQLTAESPHHASGNYGLLDQAAALAWVKENIRAFGGDPANLTIFGESAGSFSVSSQMASPLSRGLLARAIGESGAAFASTGLSYPALAEAQAEDAKFAQDAFGTSKLKDLRKLTPDQLIAAATSKTSHPPHFGPDVDGYFLPKPVADIYAAGEQAHIPTMGGWNADEIREAVLKAPTPPTAASFQAQAHMQYGENADAFLAAYPATTDEQALRSAGDLADDRFIAFSTWRWLEAQVKTGQSPRLPLPLRPARARQHLPLRRPRLALRRHRIRVRHARLAPRRNLASRRPLPFRPDDDVLDQLRPHRRSQRLRPRRQTTPRLAALRSHRLGRDAPRRARLASQARHGTRPRSLPRSPPLQSHSVTFTRVAWLARWSPQASAPTNGRSKRSN